MFYLIEITTGDPKVEGKAVYEYATNTEAVATFHAKMGSAMKSDLYTSELLLVIDENGSVLRRERFVRPISVVEVETPESEE